MDGYFKTKEFYTYLDISRATLGRYRQQYPDFPVPIYRKGHTRSPAFYLIEAAREWKERHFPSK